MKSKGLVGHCKRDPYDVYIGRPTQWGNPFVMGESTSREDVISQYKYWLMHEANLVADAELQLKGKVLGCWCHPQPCHGDVLAKIANPTVFLPDNHISATAWLYVKDRDEADPGGTHPCDFWAADECMCKGACSCHWVEP